jgi:hypothetical protein
MKAFFVSMMLLIVVMFVIPYGGMNDSNVNYIYYRCMFIFCELAFMGAVIRYTIKTRKNESI